MRLRILPRDPASYLPPPRPRPDTYLVSVDLGEVNDPTAIVVMRRVDGAPGGKATYHLVHAERHLQVPYFAPRGEASILAALSAILRRPPLFDHGCALVLDATGAGRPVLEGIRAALWWDDPTHATEGLGPERFPVFPIVITGGGTCSTQAGYLHVPKRELAMAIHVVMADNRLRLAHNLGDMLARLSAELRAFRVKFSKKSDGAAFEAWREKDHDDIVLATAQALWLAERLRLVEQPG